MVCRDAFRCSLFSQTHTFLYSRRATCATSRHTYHTSSQWSFGHITHVGIYRSVTLIPIFIEQLWSRKSNFLILCNWCHFNKGIFVYYTSSLTQLYCLIYQYIGLTTTCFGPACGPSSVRNLTFGVGIQCAGLFSVCEGLGGGTRSRYYTSEYHVHKITYGTH